MQGRVLLPFLGRGLTIFYVPLNTKTFPHGTEMINEWISTSLDLIDLKGK